MSTKEIYSASVIVFLFGFLLGRLQGCSGCQEPGPTPSVSSSRYESLRVTPRKDSAQISVETPPRRISLKAKANRTVRSSSLISERDTAMSPDQTSSSLYRDSLVCLDSVGFFSSARDTTQEYPDTISLCLQMSTRQFSVIFGESLRKHEKVVHYTAWDTSSQIREATHTVEREREDWYVHPAIGFGGAVFGAIITFIALAFK